MMSTRDKASRLLVKLYLMRRCDFWKVTVEDILAKASASQIDFYYYYICGGEEHE